MKRSHEEDNDNAGGSGSSRSSSRSSSSGGSGRHRSPYGDGILGVLMNNSKYVERKSCVGEGSVCGGGGVCYYCARDTETQVGGSIPSKMCLSCEHVVCDTCSMNTYNDNDDRVCLNCLNR